MPDPITGMVGGSLLSTAVGASSSRRAARAQERASDATIAENRRQYDLNRQDLAPWRETGSNALGALSFEMGLSEKPEGYAGFQEAPGFQYQLEQGEKAINRAAAARGMRFSGNTLRDLQHHGQGMASQSHGNHLNRLAALAGVGQSATDSIARMGANMAAQNGNALMAAGNARASGYRGQNAAFQGGLNNLATIYGMNQVGYFRPAGGGNG